MIENKKVTTDKVEGKNPVLECLKSNRPVDKVLIQKGASDKDKYIALCKQRGILIQEVEKQKLDRISNLKNHQGVIAFVSQKNYMEFEEFLEKFKDKAPIVLIAEEITDPHNLGSMLRIAECMGVDAVIISKHRAVGLNEVVAKSSAGAIEYVPVIKVTNITKTIEILKENSFWIVGASTDATLDCSQIDYTGSIAVVIGSEGEGISRLVKSKCDFLAKIPMYGKISSLNAAVSFAIISYEASKQRHKTV